tara:strand:- start:2990 stop:3526 length:537 start_codon:yes stop_codon:yes gene_type:complete
MDQTKSGLILVVAVLTLMCAAACSDDLNGYDGLTLAGRGLVMNVSDVQKVDELTYQDVDNLYYTVGPVNSGNDLVVARITIWNTSSGKLSLFVDGEVAALMGSDREPIFALDPYDARQSLASEPPGLGRYTPLLWGTSSLPQNFNITGWMAFEVPGNAEINALEWAHVDTLSFPVSVK